MQVFVAESFTPIQLLNLCNVSAWRRRRIRKRSGRRLKMREFSRWVSGWHRGDGHIWVVRRTQIQPDGFITCRLCDAYAGRPGAVIGKSSSAVRKYVEQNVSVGGEMPCASRRLSAIREVMES